MSVILQIESSSKNCSVALSENGALIGSKSMQSDSYIHAEFLHPLVESLMEENGRTLKEVKAIAVSKGPGSYTGLRIGISAAKGFCFALNIPLISVDTTQILASAIKTSHPDFEFYVPMIDARRMEVYCATFDNNAERITADSAVILDEVFFDQWEDKRVIFLGDGAEKCRPFLRHENAIWQGFPDAAMMSNLAFAKWQQNNFEDLAYFEPFYLKDYLPGVTKKTAL